jgi:hypothetical protein
MSYVFCVIRELCHLVGLWLQVAALWNCSTSGLLPGMGVAAIYSCSVLLAMYRTHLFFTRICYTFVQATDYSSPEWLHLNLILNFLFKVQWTMCGYSWNSCPQIWILPRMLPVWLHANTLFIIHIHILWSISILTFRWIYGNASAPAILFHTREARGTPLQCENKSINFNYMYSTINTMIVSDGFLTRDAALNPELIYMFYWSGPTATLLAPLCTNTSLKRGVFNPLFSSFLTNILDYV